MGTNAPPIEPWSTLLEELLEIILLKLDLCDHIRFGAVCKRWRSIADANTTANKPLSLVRSPDSVSVIYRLFKSLGNMQWHDARFIGSLKGWLVLRLSYQIILPELGSRETKRQLILLNPGSRLPPILLPVFDWRTPATVQKVVLSSPPDEYTATDKCAIVYRDSDGFLGFCKLGDTKWTTIPFGGCGIGDIRDIVFYNEQLYFIDRKGVLWVYDSGLNSAPTCCSTFPPCFESYMLISSNKLLLIQIHVPCLIKAFEIDRGMRSSYIEIKSLGDNTILFLSKSCSLCLPAEENPEFIPNRIYILNKLKNDNDQRGFCSGSLDEERLVEINTEKIPLFFTLFRNVGFKNMDAGK